MRPPPSAARRVKAGGAVVAVVGFLLTRYTVLESIQQGGDLLGFLVGQAAFLVLGLGITAFGIGLAVSTHPPAYVNTVARWCLLGAGSILAVVALTYLESMLSGSAPVMVPSGEVTARVVIAGTVGGTLTGISAATARRHREDLSRQAARLTALNRILRHEVLNKVNVIRGYAETADRSDATLEAISESAERIDEAIDEVGHLARDEADGYPRTAVDLAPHLRAAVGTARERHPDVAFEVGSVPDPLPVIASDRVREVFRHLLENAAVHNDADDPRVEVSAERTPATVRVRIADNGPGLPAGQRRLLEEGSIPEYDDPSAGFGLTVVRLLLERVGAGIEAEVDDGTAIVLEFARERDDGGAEPYGVSPDRLLEAVGAAIVAGVLMGGIIQGLTGQMAVIGALYGVENVAVGWITHLFHSVVFGLIFAALASRPRLSPYADRPLACVAMGVGYGVVLWLVAAGFVMPLWLRALGVPAPVPTLRLPSLLAHLLWGAALGGLIVALRRV